MDIKNGMNTMNMTNTYKNMTFNINTMNTNNKRKHPKKDEQEQEISTNILKNLRAWWTMWTYNLGSNVGKMVFLWP